MRRLGKAPTRSRQWGKWAWTAARIPLRAHLPGASLSKVAKTDNFNVHLNLSTRSRYNTGHCVQFTQWIPQPFRFITHSTAHALTLTFHTQQRDSSTNQYPTFSQNVHPHSSILTPPITRHVHSEPHTLFSHLHPPSLQCVDVLGPLSCCPPPLPGTPHSPQCVACDSCPSSTFRTWLQCTRQQPSRRIDGT
jgi:hypothetical protein